MFLSRISDLILRRRHRPGLDTQLPEPHAVTTTYPFEQVECLSLPQSAADVREADYLAMNPDVAASGLTAVDHFNRHGLMEGRRQAANVTAAGELRERKLQRLRFLRPPNQPRRPGEAMNFLTPELIDEFRIPEHPPISAHVYGDFMREMLAADPDKMFLDIGSGLRPAVFGNMVNMDIFPAVSTDIVAVGEHLPFASNQFDFILCAAVLEHTRRPWDVAREICRVAKIGATIRIDYPFISTVHGYPNHYFNATPEGSISLFEKFCEIRSSTVELNYHPMQGVWWLLSAWRSGLPDEDRVRFESMTLGELLARPPEAQLADGFCRNLDMEVQRIIPAGSTLVAVKLRDPD